jgi:hypothetical protein
MLLSLGAPRVTGVISDAEPGDMPNADTGDGAVAQLGERLVRNEEVRGSIPLSSTTIPGSHMIFVTVQVGRLGPKNGVEFSY